MVFWREKKILERVEIAAFPVLASLLPHGACAHLLNALSPFTLQVDEVKRDAPSLEAPERRKSRPKTLMQPQPPMPVMKERMAAELPAAAVRAPPPPRPLSSPPAEVAMVPA